MLHGSDSDTDTAEREVVIDIHEITGKTECTAC